MKNETRKKIIQGITYFIFVIVLMVLVATTIVTMGVGVRQDNTIIMLISIIPIISLIFLISFSDFILR